MSELHEQSRAAFEAAILKPWGWGDERIKNKKRGNPYADLDSEFSWKAWKAALDYAASRECVWEDDQSFVFHTDCGNTFTYFEAPDTEQFPFCACGGRVKIQEQPQTNEEQ